MANNFRVAGFVLGLAIKAPVKTTSIVNVANLSGAGQVIGGYTTLAFDRVLLTAQTDPINNGIYSVRTSAWIRDGDFNGNRDIVGGTIVPSYRTADGEILFYIVDGVPTIREIGVDAINFSVFYDPTLAGIAEAPIDTMAYVRKDAGWVLESSSSLPAPGVSSVLAGDGTGSNWLIASNITINQSSGSLQTQGSVGLSDGTDVLSMSTAGGVMSMIGTGGLTHIEIIPTVRFRDSIRIQEQASSLFDVATYGEFWIRSDVDNVPMFTSDAGTDQNLDPSVSEINLQNGNYTTVLADKGKTIRKDSGGAGETFTIEAEATVNYKLGTWIAFDNDGGGTVTIAIAGADTLIFADDGTTGPRTLSDGGFAVAFKNAAGQWKISGRQLA